MPCCSNLSCSPSYLQLMFKKHLLNQTKYTHPKVQSLQLLPKHVVLHMRTFGTRVSHLPLYPYFFFFTRYWVSLNLIKQGLSEHILRERLCSGCYFCFLCPDFPQLKNYYLHTYSYISTHCVPTSALKTEWIDDVSCFQELRVKLRKQTI